MYAGVASSFDMSSHCQRPYGGVIMQATSTSTSTGTITTRLALAPALALSLAIRVSYTRKESWDANKLYIGRELY